MDVPHRSIDVKTSELGKYLKKLNRTENLHALKLNIRSISKIFIIPMKMLNITKFQFDSILLIEAWLSDETI